MNKDLAAMYTNISNGESAKFNGLYIDTCANRSSVMSYSQYKAYCEEFNVPVRINTSDRRHLRGIGGGSTPIGTTVIPVPFPDLNLVIDVRFQIIRENVPSLLCMKDMMENGLDISIQDKEVRYKHLSQSLHLQNYFLIHKWKYGDATYTLYTEPELKKLHRSFGHPSVSALTNVLKRARPSEMNKSVQEMITEISKACVQCATIGSRPKRFKLTVGADDLQFNHIVAVDIMYILSKPVLHVVDEATHYGAALFLNKVSSEKVWKALLRCCSRIDLGPPDFLRVDQGSQFVSKEFLENAETEGISVLQAPVESPTTMSHVERYHGPLRLAYLKIRESLPRTETDADCLQMAVKSVNNTIGPEGLCPTLLVYGSIPRPARSTPADTQIARAKAIDKAMYVVHREQAKRRVAFGLKSDKGPRGLEQSIELRKLPAGSPVLIFRKDSKRWEGPFKFIQIEGETVVIQLPYGRKIFRSNVVKPVVNAAEMLEDTLMDSVSSKSENTQVEDNVTTALLSEDDIYEYFGAYETMVMEHSNDADFSKSRAKELEGLIQRDTFEIVDENLVPKRARIYGSRFVDSLKTINGKTFQKSRLVAQNYRDKGATFIATKSPTVSRLGLRIAIVLAAIFNNLTMYSRDISQAYIQSESKLERDIFIRAPPEMNLPPGKLLKVLKPLSGIPESGLHWFLTYINHHRERLGMISTQNDPCILYKREGNELIGVAVLQVDESLGFGTDLFLNKEERESSRFQSKPRSLIKARDSCEFNGHDINARNDSSRGLTQSNKLRSLTIPETSDEFVSSRAKAQYIGCCTRPDICAAVQIQASAATAPSKHNFKVMKEVIKRCQDTADIGLRFVPLDKDTLRLVLFTDASFANNENLKSQIGFVLALADDSVNANIVHYGSSQCKRVTRSVMAAEVHALVYGFDNAFVVKEILEEVLGKAIPIDGIIDFRTLFNIVAKNSATQEKGLQIDVHALRESHDRGELRCLAWAPGNQNAADGLTKELVKDNHPLWRLMVKSKLQFDPIGWIEGSENK